MLCSPLIPLHSGCHKFTRMTMFSGCVHAASACGGHVGCAAGVGGDGRLAGAGGRLQHQVRGLLRAKDAPQVHDRRYVGIFIGWLAVFSISLVKMLVKMTQVVRMPSLND